MIRARVSRHDVEILNACLAGMDRLPPGVTTSGVLFQRGRQNLRRCLSLFTAFGVLALAVSGAAGPHGRMRQADAQTDTPIFIGCEVDNKVLAMDSGEKDLLDLINRYRVADGEEPLQADFLLQRIARWKAKDERDFVVSGGDPNSRANNGHDDAFRDWDQRFSDCAYSSFFGPDSTGITAPTHGENIAGGLNNAADILAQFKNSPRHDKNMKCPSYKSVGIARLDSNDPNLKFTVWLVDFGGEVDIPLESAVNDINKGQDPLANLPPRDYTDVVYAPNCDLLPQE